MKLGCLRSNNDSTELFQVPIPLKWCLILWMQPYFPSGVLAHLHIEPSEPNTSCIFCYIFGEKRQPNTRAPARKPETLVPTLPPCGWPLSFSCFRHAVCSMCFLKDNSEGKTYLSVKQITFQTDTAISLENKYCSLETVFSFDDKELQKIPLLN